MLDLLDGRWVVTESDGIVLDEGSSLENELIIENNVLGDESLKWYVGAVLE